MSSDQDQARLIAERVARRMSGGRSGSTTQSNARVSRDNGAPVSAELTAIRSGLHDLARKLDSVESKIVQGTTGAPIAISNVHWSAAASLTSGNGSVSVGSAQYLGTSDVVVASGLEGSHSPCTIQVTFTLTVNNSWTYDADTYLQNLVLTATAN